MEEYQEEEERLKEIRAKYRVSEKGKKASERYLKSEKGKLAQLKYYNSDKGLKTRSVQSDLRKLLSQVSKTLKTSDTSIEEIIKHD